MFSYIDSSIRKQLLERGQWQLLSAEGWSLEADFMQSQGVLNVIGPVPLPIQVAGKSVTFHWYAFVHRTELAQTEKIAEAIRAGENSRLFSLLSTYMAVNSVLVLGDLKAVDRPSVRIHSCCMTGDVFGSERCECGPQLQAAFKRIAEEGTGALIYMAGHEGRGIGLWAKAVTYLLQDAGQDTYQANRSLGLPDDFEMDAWGR
jgi:GTP cyclohydrolase II